MSSRADDRHRRERSRSRSRDRPQRDDRDRRSRSRERYRGRDGERYEERAKGKERDDDRRRSPVRRRSASPRRSRSRDKHRKRSRSRSRSSSADRYRSRKGERRRSKSRSRSRSVSSSSSVSSDEKRHKKKHKHKRKRSRSRDKEKKERKKEKKEKKKKKLGAVSHQWGKYGIINETDLYNKEPEFRAWLVEERIINPETISKDQTRKEFAKFVEDFNTATLPHEKFYDITSYERRMTALRSGEFVPPSDDTYDPNADMRALQGAHKRKQKEDVFMSRDQLMELRKVQAERIEAGKMKLLGMEIKQNMGVRMDGTMFDD